MTQPDPRRHACKAGLAASRLRGQIESDRYVEGHICQVTKGVVAVRRRPGHDEPLDTQASYGDTLTVYEDVTDEVGEPWVWAQLEADSYVGYLPAHAISRSLVDATHRVSVPSTLLFPEADLKRPPLDMLPMGARVAVIELVERRGTGYAVLPDGSALPARHLVDLTDLAHDFVDVALRLIDTPYLWGGRSSFGIDCSGLVQLSFAEAGMPAPRDSDMQENEIGIRIETDPHDPQAQRGDLVFWPGHVGIMVDEARLVHANAHHMATAVEPLSSTIARLERQGILVSSIRRIGV